MYYQRELKDSWLDASSQFAVLLLTGPRQAGKTTFLRHICEEGRRYVTLDDPVVRSLANEEPTLFLQRHPTPILIDEIQYAPDLLPHIKMAVDAGEERGGFWLTGSQHFLMMRGMSESLAGRIAIMNLLGFSRRERHRTGLGFGPFLPTPKILEERESLAARSGLGDIYREIWAGCFPGLVAGPVRNRDLFYSSYLQTYIQRDVRDLAQVGDDAAFLRFLRACAARTGQLLNLSDLARDADVSHGTAKNWLSILQTSMVVVLLQPYYSNLTKRLVKSPKLYFLDTGLCAYLTEWSSPGTLEAGALSGPILETFVFTEILKSWWHRGESPPVYYYRDKDRREIDFLFVFDQTLYPVEVRKSASPSREWVRRFSALERLGLKIGTGGVFCFSSERIPLDESNEAIPIGML